MGKDKDGGTKFAKFFGKTAGRENTYILTGYCRAINNRDNAAGSDKYLGRHSSE